MKAQEDYPTIEKWWEKGQKVPYICMYMAFEYVDFEEEQLFNSVMCSTLKFLNGPISHSLMKSVAIDLTSRTVVCLYATLHISLY